MDPEVAARIESLVALIWSLIGVVILLIVALFTQPECRDGCQTCQEWRDKRRDTAVRRYFGVTPTTPVQMCKLHQRPRHECRDEEHE